MSTKAKGVYAIHSDWSDGTLIFYEKAYGMTTTGNILKVGATAVQVGDTANLVDFAWKATPSLSAVISASGATLTLVGITSTTNKPLTITDATGTSSTTTGALIVTGGIATAADVWVGDDLFFASGAIINFAASDVTITHASGALTCSGIWSISNATESTSTTTGALAVVGGIGFQGDMYAGDDIFLTSGAVLNFAAGNVTITHSTGALACTGALTVSIATESTSTTTGALIVTGGIGFGGDMYVGDDVFLSSGAILNFAAGNVTITHSTGALACTGALTVSIATESTSTTTGALIVTGGIGFGGDMYVGDDVFLTSAAKLDWGAGNVTLTHSTGQLAGVAAAGFTFTSATLNATSGRVGKFVGSVAAPNQGDGYGAFEVDITASGTYAGTTNASSTWLNVAAAAVPGGNLICVHNDGIYLPAGITASSATMIMGSRMHYVADDGANPGSLYLWSTNIYDNVLTAMLHVNTIVDLGGSTGAVTTNAYKIPLFKDVTANKVWYVNVYDS